MYPPIPILGLEMTLVLTLIAALHVTFVSAFGGSGEVATCVKSRFMPRPTIGRRSIFGVKKLQSEKGQIFGWKKGSGLGCIQTICCKLQIVTKTGNLEVGKVLTCDYL